MRFKISTSEHTCPGKVHDEETGFTIYCYDAWGVCDYLNNLIDSYTKTLHLPKVREDAEKMSNWRPISTAPLDGTLILVKGDSGNTTHKFFTMTAYYDAEYRPQSPWLDVCHDCLDDYGFSPDEWMPIPE